MEDQKIIDVCWLSSRWTMGMVLADTGFGLRAYLGVGKGYSSEDDAKEICDWGRKMTFEEAKPFFPTRLTDKSKYAKDK